MSDIQAGLNSFNMNYLPTANIGWNQAALPEPDFSCGLFNTTSIGAGALYPQQGIFPVNNNFMMQNLNPFGNFDPFGLSSLQFNVNPQINYPQNNFINSMLDNFIASMNNTRQSILNFNFQNFFNTQAGNGNYNQKATDLYRGSAADLNKHLSGVLKGKGAKLIELQNKYGVSASMMAAIVNCESAYGKSSAARTKNNVAGIMSKSSNYNKLATFDSVDDCLEALAKNLRNNYINKELVTVSQIHSKYCPVGAANDPTGMNGNWGRSVAQLTDKYNGLV